MAQTTRNQRHRRTALPYKYREDGLEFTLESCVLSGETRADLVRGDGRAVELHEVGDWETAELRGHIGLGEGVVEDVVPEPEREAVPARLYVAVRCRASVYRDSIPVARSPTEPGNHDVTLEVDREELRGRVDLVPFLTRVEESEGTHPRYGTTPGLRLASGQSWTAQVDAPSTPGDQMIDGEERSFEEDDSLPPTEHLYYVDFSQAEQPKLFLNSDHGRVMGVLRSEGSTGVQARMRDVILDEITYGVWAQLIFNTASDVSEGDEYEPRHEWQETILERFGTDIYDVDDEAEAARRLYEDVRSPEDIPLLMEGVDHALQGDIRHRDQLIKLMEEGLNL